MNDNMHLKEMFMFVSTKFITKSSSYAIITYIHVTESKWSVHQMPRLRSTKFSYYYSTSYPNYIMWMNHAEIHLA